MITITVRFFSHFLLTTQKKEIQLEISEAATIEEAVKELFPIFGDDLRNELIHKKTNSIQAICAVNAKKVTPDTVLYQNDTLLLFPPLSGG